MCTYSDRVVIQEHRKDNPEVTRFESRRAYHFLSSKFVLNEELRCSTGVYVRRWYLETPYFSVRLHHWLHSDDNRAFHDHPWWFITLILKGSYTDLNPIRSERMTPGKVAYRPALHQHTAQIDPGGCWTLLLTGPKIRQWGFYVRLKNKIKFKKSNKYFLEHGTHVCD
jgi:hypothetical protein